MTEIKISDLSIGDWVRVDDFDKVLIKRVSAIDGTRNQIGIIKNNRSGIYWYYDDECEPIPLTPEILEKNGWSRKKDYGWYLFYDKDTRINIWFDKDRWDIEVSSEDRGVSYADITGRGTLHTHQLQHALRLAGMGKEIEV